MKSMIFLWHFLILSCSLYSMEEVISQGLVALSELQDPVVDDAIAHPVVCTMVKNFHARMGEFFQGKLTDEEVLGGYEDHIEELYEKLSVSSDIQDHKAYVNGVAHLTIQLAHLPDPQKLDYQLSFFKEIVSHSCLNSSLKEPLGCLIQTILQPSAPQLSSTFFVLKRAYHAIAASGSTLSSRKKQKIEQNRDAQGEASSLTWSHEKVSEAAQNFRKAIDNYPKKKFPGGNDNLMYFFQKYIQVAPAHEHTRIFNDLKGSVFLRRNFFSRRPSRRRDENIKKHVELLDQLLQEPIVCSYPEWVRWFQERQDLLNDLPKSST